MRQEEAAMNEERRAVQDDMSRRSSLRAESLQLGDRVRLLPWAQYTLQGTRGTVVAIEPEPRPGEPLGAVLVALHDRPPVSTPVSVSPDLLEIDRPFPQG